MAIDDLTRIRLLDWMSEIRLRVLKDIYLSGNNSGRPKPGPKKTTSGEWLK